MCNQVKLYVISCHVFVNFNVSLPVFVLKCCVYLSVCVYVSLFSAANGAFAFMRKGRHF